MQIQSEPLKSGLHTGDLCLVDGVPVFGVSPVHLTWVTGPICGPGYVTLDAECWMKAPASWNCASVWAALFII